MASSSNDNDMNRIIRVPSNNVNKCNVYPKEGGKRKKGNK